MTTVVTVEIMHIRKHQKPSWPAKRSRPAKPGSPKNHSSFDFSSISTILALVSVIISGASTYIAWISVKEISKDRQAVFQSVQFDQQNDSSRALLLAMAEYQQATLCGVSIQRLAGTQYDSHESRQECVREVSQTYSKLEIIAKSEISVWDQKTQKPITNFLLEASRLNACLPPILLFYRSEPFEISDLKCTIELENESDKLLDGEMNVRRAIYKEVAETKKIL